MSTRKPARILRLPEVLGRVGLCQTQVGNLERAGKFPKRIKIGGGFATGWLERDIEKFIADSVAASRRKQTPEKGQTATP